MITYRLGNDVDVGSVQELYRSAALRRPVDDAARIAAMVANASLVVSAWDGRSLVGIARSFSDFAYVTYLADLAVLPSHQRQGIGVELVRRTRAEAPLAQIVLLAAPGARDYYPAIGFAPHPSAWVLKPEDPLR